MIIFPAIDLKDGQCVRLIQGRAEDKTVYSKDPAAMAAKFQEQGAQFLHIVDLDGAFTGKPANIASIESIAKAITIPFQVGGGLRTKESIEILLACGAARVIVGTKAVKSAEFMKDIIRDFGPERIVLGLDARNGMVAIEGWVETVPLSALEFGRQMYELGIRTVVYTDISRDGLLEGPNFLATEELAKNTGLKVIASGGVTQISDLKKLKALESSGVIGAIIGKAIYDGKLDLREALQAVRA